MSSTESRRDAPPRATVVAVDRSEDCLFQGASEAMKQALLALLELADADFPDDVVDLVSFSAFAQPLSREAVATLQCDEGTWGGNWQHALVLAQEHLDRSPAAVRRILLLAATEPTAHLERDRSYFAYPPSPITLRHTLTAIGACREAGIDVRVFLVNAARCQRDVGELLAEEGQITIMPTTAATLQEHVLAAFRATP